MNLRSLFAPYGIPFRFLEGWTEAEVYAMLGRLRSRRRLGKHYGGATGDEPHPGTGTPQTAHSSKPEGMTIPLYHGTASSLVDKVLREGILPGSLTGNRIWTSLNEGERFNNVFLAANEADARAFGELARDMAGADGVVIFHVQLPENAPLLPDEEFESGFRLDDIVRPDQIVGYTIYRLETGKADERVALEKARVFYAPILFGSRLRRKVERAAKSYSLSPM